MKIDRRALLLGTASLAGAVAAPLSKAARASEPPPLPQGVSSRFARVNGVRLHYVVLGSGPAVILLHGWPETWVAWLPVMQRLAARFTLIAPDLRGTGRSEITPSGYDKRTIAEDICALAAHLGLASASIVGHDMGGKAAYVLAHLHPDLVAKLVLADCLVPGTENMDAMRGGAWHYGFHIAQDFPELLTKGREAEYIAAQIRAWSYRKDAITPERIAEYAYYYSRPGAMTAGFNYYRALRDDAAFVGELRGSALDMPVLTITGRHGVGDKLAHSLTSEANALTSTVVEESGHFVPEEAPDRFCAALEAFL